MRGGEALRLSGFFGGLAVKERLAPQLLVRPLVAELFLTENCNLRCVSCACWRTNTRDELTTAQWRDVLDQLAALRIHKVNFTGGEPLIRRDAVELMTAARAAGIRHLHLNTNGLLLTPTMLAAVLEAGVRSFNISVDGPTALVHDRIRGRLGSFEQTVEHLRGLLAERERHRLRVRMNFTVMRDNVGHLADMARLAQRLQVRLYLNLGTDRTFLFRTAEVSAHVAVDQGELDAALAELESVARADPTWLPRFSDLSYIRGHFTDVVQPRLPCAESQLKLMIHSRGQVGGCWGEDPTFDLRTSSLEQVLSSPAYRAEQARLFRKQCVGCGSNYSLNLRWRPGSYVADGMARLGARSLAGR